MRQQCARRKVKLCSPMKLNNLFKEHFNENFTTRNDKEAKDKNCLLL